MSSRRAVIVGVLVAVVVVAVVAAVRAWRNDGPAQRQTIIAQVQANTLVPDAQGVIALPTGLAGATVDGRIFLTTRPNGKRWILFRAWCGKAANLRGYLYTAGDVLAVDKMVSVTTEMAGLIGPAEVVVVSDLGGSWYRVSRSLD